MLTNKYAEEYPGRRYYGGQQYTDLVERVACDRAGRCSERTTRTYSRCRDLRGTKLYFSQR